MQNKHIVNNTDCIYHCLGVNRLRKKNILEIYILEFLDFYIFNSL